MGLGKRTATEIASVSTLVYGLAQVFDVGLTFLLSPDLARETNVVQQWFDIGWPGLILAAVFLTLVMFLVQKWMWARLFRHIPERPAAYRSLYQRLLRGDTQAMDRASTRPEIAGIAMGVAFIVAYAAIASKLMTVAWNLSVALFSIEGLSPLVVRLTKGVLAAAVGVVVFFAVPYWLNRGDDA